MKPMQIITLVVAVLLAAAGVVGKFTDLFSPGVVAWVGLGVGVVGALATRLLPPLATILIPPHIGKVLSQLNGGVLAVAAAAGPLLPQMPGVTPGVLRWYTFSLAVAGALGAALLPHEKRPDADASPILSRIATLLLFVTAFNVVSCGPAWQSRWETLGVDSVKCAGQSVAPVAVTLLVQALAAATGTQTDWGAVGEQLGAKYGTQAGGCILQAAIDDLGKPAAHPSVSPGDMQKRQRALAVAQYLWKHPEHVERGAKARASLEEALTQRDIAPLDLDALRQRLGDQYGDATAMRAAHAAWAARTDEPETRASDVLWLVSQPPRVRDVAWILAWSTSRKAVR